MALTNAEKQKRWRDKRNALAKLGAARMKILKLTAPSGNDHRGDTAIYVVADSINSFYSPPGTEFTVLKLSGQMEQVRETPEQILGMLGVPGVLGAPL